MKPVKCTQCDGYYKVREGKYGIFAGCSNYPKCKSTLKIPDLLVKYFKMNGVNIYRWDKVCWKCKKPTKVYSYYLDYEFGQIYGSFGGSIGLGDVPYLDKILTKKYATIDMRSSKTTKSSYVANTCEHCGALQGRNYVVEDPHEIMNELYSEDNSMKKYLVETLQIESEDEFKRDMQALLSYLNK